MLSNSLWLSDPDDPKPSLSAICQPSLGRGRGTVVANRDDCVALSSPRICLYLVLKLCSVKQGHLEVPSPVCFVLSLLPWLRSHLFTPSFASSFALVYDTPIRPAR